MLDTRNKHLQLEWDTWLRSLYYMQQENVFLKTNLAYIIKNDTGTGLLEKAEYFQSRFVNNDTVIGLLRYDIAGLEKIMGVINSSANNDSGIWIRQDKIRADMAKTEQDFSQLKLLFNSYLAQELQLL